MIERGRHGGERGDDELIRLLDLSLDPFCVAGFDGYLKWVNEAFERTLGYSREELTTRPYLDFVHPEDLELTRDALGELALGKDVVGFQARNICADGSVRWLEWNTRTMPREGLVYGVARDVTDRRRAEAELRDAHRLVEASRSELRMLAEEQAALRRVATLVAQGVPPDDVLAAVAEEVARVMHVPRVTVSRYESDDTATVLASFSERDLPFEAGTRVSLEGTNMLTIVRASPRPARIDDWSGLQGVIAERARRNGIRSSVGAPIVVAGLLWGAIVVSSRGPGPLPEDTEARLVAFTELVATAIANAASRAALGRLAEEQAALRRVATLVARGVRPVEIFSAVSEEVARLVGSGAAVLKFEHDGPAIVFVGLSTGVDIAIGTRWKFQDGMASAEVYRTGRSARVDAMDWSSAGGAVAAAARRLGVLSTVVSPIVAEGRLWGAVTVSSSAEILPLDAEERLEKFTELVATAIANAESRSELAASRRRIVTAADEARRRIERDLHDGTQQRLVSLSFTLRAVESTADLDEARDTISRAAHELDRIMGELREISRGIHPAILSEGGLGPAMATLARRSAIPVELDVGIQGRLPEPIEVAAYYVVSEALTNAIKHARASRAQVVVSEQGGSLLLRVRDDGVGGADAARGSGLIGLADRVEALGGAIEVRSRRGEGTHVCATLPLDLDQAAGPRAAGPSQTEEDR